ncbi:MAG: HDOD domain-containing protein [Gammaproteobacteria bacterium]|nr:HDOD domain-containing protein [Gammaproteobacteria bacterium]
MQTTAKELVADVSDLVSLPDICVRVNEMVNDPDSSAADIGKIIAQEPGMMARLLRIANSPFYGFMQEITTVSRAISVIGTAQLRELILATSAIDTFENIPNYLVNMKHFWTHSIYTGLCAKALADKTGSKNNESYFVAGLLHDIGQLVLFNKMPEESRDILIEIMEGSEGLQFHQEEKKVFGFDHAEVGAELLRNWKLPEVLCDSVKFHHQPLKAKSYSKEAALIHIANSLGCLAELDSENDWEAEPIDPQAWQAAGLKPDVIEQITDKVAEEFNDVANSFLKDTV